MKTIFLRALEADDKAVSLLAAIREPATAMGRQRFEVDPRSFTDLPGAPFAYWASERLRSAFRAFPPFASGKNTVKQGLASGDDFRFMRLWWEVCPTRIGMDLTWVTVSKGGESRPYYADLPLVLGYSRAEQVGIQQLGRFGRGATHYYLPGLTYPLRARRFCPQALPAGAITTVRGSGIYAFPDPAVFLALLNASVVDYLLKLMLGRGGHPQFDMGDIALVPVPPIPINIGEKLAQIATRAWALRRSLDTRNEISHAFSAPSLLQVSGDTLQLRSAAWNERVRSVESQLETAQNEIDAICFDLYGIDEEGRRSISEGFGADLVFSDNPEESDDPDDVEPGEGDTEGHADESVLAAELMSWMMGVAFGRFDISLAANAHIPSTEPGPFDPLPVCSSAMLTGNNGLPLMSVPPEYPITFPENGILVDDRGHPRDLTTAVRVAFDQVFSPNADYWWNEIGVALDPRNGDLRAWLSTSFFESHLKCCSRSRRKAPILWQLAVPSGRYSIWLYAHRLTGDSFFQIQNDVVIPKLAHEERQLSSLMQSAGGNPSARERKEIAAQEVFVEELRALLEEIKRVAPMWNPMLDDGVVLTMALLWRLVPQHKPWQKELKAKWEELTAGKFDWAKTAMHFWPERVVPKCASDRSLAIAHGLDTIFWMEGDHGRWTPRQTPASSIDELVRQRTSIAVKAALKSLLTAPTASADGGRGRLHRTINPAADVGAF